MDDISTALSISKKTIYQIFKDKNEVVCQVAEMQMMREKEKIDEIKKTSGNAIEELYGYSSCIRDLFTSINPVVLYDLKKYHQDAWNIYLEYKQNVFYHSISNTLSQGIKEGYFRKDINVEVLTILRLEEFQISIDEAIFPSENYSLVEVQTQLFKHYLYGIVTEDGYKKVNEYLKTIYNHEDYQ